MESKSNGNGYVKWHQLVTTFISIIAIIAVVSIALANNFNEKLEKNSDRTDHNKDCFHIIDTRLARIEAKLGIE